LAAELIKHEAVIELFNEVLALAHEKDSLRGKHFYVHGHKSFMHKNDGDREERLAHSSTAKATPRAGCTA